MNVLSLFDGMSCGQQALERTGIKVDNYFASEIDKYAIQVTMANYPNTTQLGSVVDVDGYSLPKIDILIGGSPCQSFSFAGKRKGMSTKDEQEILTLDHYLRLKSEGYEFEGQSYLFWEYMRLLNEVKPTYFLLENVMMGEKWEKVLSKAIGVNAIEINSALVSAQNRRRLYWTNIGMEASGLFGDLESIIEQPKDREILLRDVLESEVDEKYFLSENSFIFDRIKNNHPFTPRIPNKDEKSNYLKIGGSGVDDLIVHNTMPRSGNPKKGGTGPLSRTDGKTYCLDTGNTNAVEVRGIIQHIIPEIVNVRKYNVDIHKLQECLKKHKNKSIKEIAMQLDVSNTTVEHWFRTDKYFSIPDRDIWFNLKKCLNIKTNDFDESIIEYIEKESVYEKTNRVYDENGISPTLTSTSADERILVREMDSVSKIANITSRIRRLTPIECERLQTVKDNYTNHVSDSQRYKMLGNGWTVEVITHIFKYIT